MTARWIAAGLVALALVSCNKKDEVKPPPPAPETPAPPPVTNTEAPPVSGTPPKTGYRRADQPSGYKPADPPTGYTATDGSGDDTSPKKKVPKTGSTTSTDKVVVDKKTGAQSKVEADVVGGWRQQGKTAMLRFKPDGWVSLERGDNVVNGKWTSRNDGAIDFTLAVSGGEAKLVGRPSSSKPTGRILTVLPSKTGPQVWSGQSQLIFSRE